MSHRPLPVPSGGGQQANGHPPKPLPRPGVSPFNNRGPAPKTMPARAPSSNGISNGDANERWSFHPIIDLPPPPAFKNIPKHYPSGGKSSSKVTAPSKPIPATPSKPGAKLSHQAPPPTLRGNATAPPQATQPKPSANPPPRPNAPPPKPSAGAPPRPGGKPAVSTSAPAVNPSQPGDSSSGGKPPARPAGGPPPRPSTTPPNAVPPKLPSRPAK